MTVVVFALLVGIGHVFPKALLEPRIQKKMHDLALMEGTEPAQLTSSRATLQVPTAILVAKVGRHVEGWGLPVSLSWRQSPARWLATQLPMRGRNFSPVAQRQIRPLSHEGQGLPTRCHHAWKVRCQQSQSES